MSRRFNGARVAALTLATFACIGLSAVTAAAPAPDDDSIARDIIRLTNAERVSHGLGALTEASDLDRAARNHSVEMRDLNYFAHNSPNPNQHSVLERVRSVGGTDTSLGENLSKVDGYASQQIAAVSVDGWMHSPGHRANMLEPEFNRIGVSVVRSGNHAWVTQVFSMRSIEMTAVTPEAGRGVSLVTGRVVNGPRSGALFINGDFVTRFEAAPDGRFSVACPLPRQGELGLGQTSGTDARETWFKIVTSTPIGGMSSAQAALPSVSR